jgi:type I restriction-modification system DNA methylase subunit
MDSSVHYDIATSIDDRDAPSDERRRLGAHYTSRIITRIVVERALAPLISSATSSATFLDLRICDPAMGSGAFVLEVC